MNILRFTLFKMRCMIRERALLTDWQPISHACVCKLANQQSITISSYQQQTNCGTTEPSFSANSNYPYHNTPTTGNNCPPLKKQQRNQPLPLSISSLFSISHKLTFCFIFANNPPTLAAKWITCVGFTLSKIASVSFLSLKSPSLEERKIHVSFGRGLARVYVLMAWPTRPEPPVTMMVDLVVPPTSCLVMVAVLSLLW